jgi:polyhydroxyalkanoate synthesis regulator phasin
VALVKEHALTSDEVRKVVDEIFQAAKKEEGFYEGWSTVLADEIVK